MRRYRSGNISIEAVSVNVNRSCRFIVARLISVHFFTIVVSIRARASARNNSSVVSLVTFGDLIPRHFFRVRSFAPREWGYLRNATASLLNEAAYQIALSRRWFAFLQVATQAINRFTQRSTATRQALSLGEFAYLTYNSAHYYDRSRFIGGLFYFFQVFFRVVYGHFTCDLIRNAARFTITRLNLNLSFRLQLNCFR